MIKNLIECSLNFIFPPICGLCKKMSKSYLCEDCLKMIEKNEKNVLQQHEKMKFDSHFWMFEYKDEIRDRIIEYKFNDSSYLFRFFLEIILKNKEAVTYIEKFDYIIPMPLHKKRLKKRGYNQTELIVKALQKNGVNIIIKKDVLKKCKNTVPQSTLNKVERMSNIQGAFTINPNVEKNEFCKKNVLLFDDVYTTGSTANECAKVLSQLHCKQIGIFSIAKD